MGLRDRRHFQRLLGHPRLNSLELFVTEIRLNKALVRKQTTLRYVCAAQLGRWVRRFAADPSERRLSAAFGPRSAAHQAAGAVERSGAQAPLCALGSAAAPLSEATEKKRKSIVKNKCMRIAGVIAAGFPLAVLMNKGGQCCAMVPSTGDQVATSRILPFLLMLVGICTIVWFVGRRARSQG